MYGRFFLDLYTVCSVSAMPLRTVTPANWCMVFNVALHRTYMRIVLWSDMIEPNSVQSSGGQLWYQPEQSWNSISIQNAIMPCRHFSDVLFWLAFEFYWGQEAAAANFKESIAKILLDQWLPRWTRAIPNLPPSPRSFGKLTMHISWMALSPEKATN